MTKFEVQNESSEIISGVMTAGGVAAVIRQNLSFSDVRKITFGLVVNVLVEGEHQRRGRR